uniref:Catechol-O-methyltransferase domain containing 1 n=1 Tax=Pseudonaja textilis TaxID=8673 RepID=A0A670ZTI4_PSETE
CCSQCKRHKPCVPVGHVASTALCSSAAWINYFAEGALWVTFLFSAGYNTLSMALVLPEDGRIVACEVNEDMASIGKPVWKEAGVLRKIDLRIKPAIETLEELLANGEAGTFDLAFIHADKESYNDYYEKCLRLIKKGKILVLDNVSTSEKHLKAGQEATDGNSSRREAT